MTKETYSHSKLDVLRKCMLLFKYKYLDKLIEEKDKSATDFGEVCHYIAETYTGTGKSELLTLYKNKLKEFTLTEFYTNKMKLALTNIHVFYKNYLENSEIVEIKKEDNITVNLNEEIDLTGKIDLFIKYKSGKVKILDYKTSKAKNSNHTNQLSMYKFLINKKYDIPYDMMETEIVYLALENLTKKGEIVLNEGIENIIIPYDVSETDVYCLTEEIKQLHNAIKNSKDKNIWECNPTWFNCTYCGYNKICPNKY